MRENKLLSNTNIEQSVLATLMSNGDSYDVIAGTLIADDFVSPKHKLIFSAIAELANDNKPYELDAVYELLARRGGIGGHGVDEQYLIQLMQEIASSTFNLKFYAESIRSKSDRRKAIAILGESIEQLKQNDDDTADVANTAMDRLTNVLTGSTDVEFELVEDMLGGLIERLEQRMRSDSPFIRTGMQSLDEKMAMNNGDLVVVAARPSMGKTNLVLNMLSGVAKYQEGTAVFFSLEMRNEQVMDRIASSEAGIHLGNIRSGQLTEDDWARLQAYIGQESHVNLAIVEKPEITIGQIRTELNRIKRERKHIAGGRISVIAVDYLQIMGGLDGADRINKIGTVTRTLKALGKEYDCPVILLSQLSRGVEQRPNKRPISSDLRDSGTIEQDADIIAMIYRDDYYKSKELDANGAIKKAPDGLAEIILTKNRNGATGSVVMGFEGHYSRFVENMPDVVINEDDYYFDGHYS